MAEVHGINSRIYIDELNASGYATEWVATFNVDLSNSEAIADTWKERLAGARGGTLSWSAHFDTTDGGYDETAFTDLTTDGDSARLGMITVATSAGNVCYEIPGKYSGQDRPSPYDGITGLNAAIESHGGISRGLTILQGATLTATGAQTGYNVGAVAAGSTTVVVYRVHSITGSIAMNCEESQNDGSPDAYASVAALASGTISSASVVKKTTTTATEAWKRINVTTAPTTASVTVTVTSY